jgi:hypothetical protein
VHPKTNFLVANAHLLSQLFSQTEIPNVANCLNDEEVVVDRSLVIKSKSGGGIQSKNHQEYDGALSRNYSVAKHARPHPGPLPRGEGETFERI